MTHNQEEMNKKIIGLDDDLYETLSLDDDTYSDDESIINCTERAAIKPRKKYAFEAEEASQINIDASHI